MKLNLYKLNSPRYVLACQPTAPAALFHLGRLRLQAGAHPQAQGQLWYVNLETINVMFSVMYV